MVSKDHPVFVKSSTWGIMFLTLYVDDILLARNNLEMIELLKYGCPISLDAGYG